MGHSHTPPSNLVGNILFFIVCLCLIVFFAANLEALYLGAEKFDLTPDDVHMIPIGALCFFIFWKLFDAMVFSPFLTLFEEREAATVEAGGSADEKKAEAEKLQKAYHERMQAVRAEVAKDRLQRVTTAQREAQSLTEKATEESQAQLEQTQKDLAATASSLRSKVFEDADTLVSEVVQKVKAPMNRV